LIYKPEDAKPNVCLMEDHKNGKIENSAEHPAREKL